jgi:subtilisin family serine protease
MKRPFIWIVLGLLCLASGWWAWQRPAKLPVKPSAPARVVATPTARTVHSAAAVPGVLTPAYTNLVKGGMTSTNPFDYRLSNTAKPLGELVRDAHAILLENALIDTGSPLNISLPQTLQSQGDPGAYIVQARGPIDGAFRAMLAAAGAQVVSYMPNDAYLVRAQAGVANALAANSKVQAVLSYEPYYKIQMPLLVLAMQDRKLPPGMTLTLGLYSDTAPQTIRQIENSGGTVFGQVKTPIGTIVDVMPPRDWLTVATLPGTKNVEIGRVARPANDISRSTVAVAQDPQVITNYLNLSGSNVLVEMNDSGVDALHPDFNTAGGVLRILGNSPLSFVDTNGHGTHVAGTIAGDGTESLTVTNAQGSIMPPMTNQFRGMAPLAKLYSVAAIDPTFGFLLTSDKNLQEIPALTNALISNNSWNYGGDAIYDLHAASFDAAVRDALSERTGSQPVLFVFSAGNDGGGGTDGTGGTPDSILSPATAKNVVTVGALEEERGITNIVTDRGSNMIPFWETRTDNGVEVTEFSSRGNVGVDIEGTFGRYKPDVVAPGSFVVSTRSSQWNEQAYYNPTNYIFTVRTNQLVNTNSLHSYSISVPANAVGVNISFVRNSRSALPFPTNLPVYVRKADFPAPTNFDILTFKDGVSIPPDSGGNITDITSIQNSGFFYGIGNTNSVPIYY